MRIKSLALLFVLAINLNSGAFASDPSEQDLWAGPWDFALPVIMDSQGLRLVVESSQKRAKSEGSAESSEENHWMGNRDFAPPEIDNRLALWPAVEESLLKRTQPEESERDADVSLQKRLRKEAPQVPPIDYISPELVSAQKDIKVLKSAPADEFGQIPREAQNGIRLFPGNADTNKLILKLLSPQDVKAVMHTCRRGYWLGRTRGHIKVASSDRVKQEVSSLASFIEAMVSDPDFPIKVLNLSNVVQPQDIFAHLRNRNKLQLLTENLVDYSWNGLRSNKGVRLAYVCDAETGSQMGESLLACSNLKSLDIALGKFSHNETNPFQEDPVPDPRLAKMAASFKGLEVFRFKPNESFMLKDLHAILRGFKCLRVLDYVPSHLLHNGQDPFQILEDENNPQSGLLSLPCLQEVSIDETLDNKRFGSLLHLCPNIRKIRVSDVFTPETLSFARDAFLLSSTLKEFDMSYKTFFGSDYFTLSRTKPGADLQLNASRHFHYGANEALEFFKMYREVFPSEVYPGVVVRELYINSLSKLGRHSCSHEFLLGLGKRISDVRILHLPKLHAYPAKTFTAFLDNLPHLVELDLSDNLTNLMPDSAYVYAAGKVKHMNVSDIVKMTPELISKILAVGNLKSLTLSLIKAREGDQVRVVINKEMVEGWRAQYPDTQIIVLNPKKSLILDIKPKKSRKKA